jgi:hypothetical protein
METKSELQIVSKAKDLCSYIMVVTQKSPKQFRFTFVSRLQNLSLDIIESVYRANEVYLDVKDVTSLKKRLDLQQTALTDIKLLAYFAELSVTQGCLLAKQYAQIAKLSTDCQFLLGAWIKSDRKRATQKPVQETLFV